jgi:hypothetical protein
MPRSPSIVPENADRDIYLVLDHFGILGRAWRETDETDTNRAKLIQHLLDGQYENPARIVAFNTAEGWWRDVTDEIARELRKRCADRGEIPPSLQDFLDEHGS